MYRRPFSLHPLRMLDVHTPSQPEEHQRPYRVSRYVAPKDIFPDYNRVMAHLTGEQEQRGNKELTNAAAKYQICKKYDTQSPNEIDANYSDSHISENDNIIFDGSYGDEDHREKMRTCRVTSDISNTYSSRANPSIAAQRKARRSEPYGNRCSSKDLVEEMDAHKRCPYVDPEDGQRCKKINRSPQEAGRHWRSCHLYKEAKAMLMGVMAIGQGTAITSKKQLEEVTPSIRCPFCSTLITRSDAMRRHVRTICSGA